MSDFAGRLGDARPPRLEGAVETHLGCDVVVHGYVSNGAAATAAGSIAAAYRRFGEELQRHVHGEYAAAVVDRRSGRALLTHDALGLVPLFYEAGSQGVVFTTALGLLASDALDERYIADWLAFGMITGARTPYNRVRRLLPGQSLVWSGSRLESRTTWSLNDVEPLRLSSDADYEERFRGELDAAVCGALDSGGRTWISLSGGLDSSAVACAAASAGERDVAAFSVVCANWPEADEREWMRAVVERCGMPWHTVDIETMLPFAELPSHSYAEPAEAVIEEARIRAQNALLREHGGRVMLTGHGGDAVLCASPGHVPRHLADPLFAGHPLQALRALAAWRRGTKTGRSHIHWLLHGLAAPALRHLRRRRLLAVDLRRPLPPWLRPDYTDAMDLQRRVQRQLAPRARLPGLQTLWHDLWLLSLANAMVPRTALGFEVRNPLLSLPLVQFMAAVPWEQKLRPDCDRYLQRRAQRGVLPESVRTRTDKGNGNPLLVEGLRRSRDWIPYLCDDPLIARHGIVDADAWRNGVLQASVGQTHDDKFLLAAIALEVWLRQREEARSRSGEAVAAA